MAEDTGDRRDLAALLHPLFKTLIAIERPILAEHEVSMWGYSVLTALADGPARTQATLAESIGADKTRIIDTLDELQQAGHILREPDPADRRARLLSITASGARVRRAVQAEIRVAEDRLLAELPAEDRQGFLRALEAFSSLSLDEISTR